MQRLPRISGLRTGVRLRPRPRVGGFENTGVTAAGPRRNGRAQNSGATPSPTQVESNSRPSLRERGVRVTRHDDQDQQAAEKEFIKRKTEVFGAEHLKSATLLLLTENKAKMPHDDKELLERIYADRTEIAGQTCARHL